MKFTKNISFAICYENARDIPGYITEKIFDCFFAGCVPIYWGGAPNVTDHIPANTFIMIKWLWVNANVNPIRTDKNKLVNKAMLSFKNTAIKIDINGIMIGNWKKLATS